MPTRDPDVLDVAVLLDLSGDRRPSGNAQRDAMQLWLDQQQVRGGPQPKVRVRTIDVGGSDGRLIIELRRAVEEQRVGAIIVGVPITPLVGAFVPAVDVARVPVFTTLPASEAVASRWLFTLAPSVEKLARAALDDATRRGLASAAVQLLPETGAALAESQALSAEAARRKLPPMTIVRVDRPDGAGSPARLVPTTAAFHVLGAPRDAAALTRGPTGPAYYLSYLTDPAELGAFRDVATARWPASRRVVSSGAPRPTASAQFVQAYGERHGPPSAHAASAYDALSLIQLAATRAGTDPARLLDRLDEITFAGIATTYELTVTRHAGFSLDDLAYVTWSSGGVALAPGPQ